jgi:ketosteroid isomerase-like protein
MPAPAARSAGQHDLAAMLEAERAFARSSVERGTREAFLAFVAEDGVVFRPLPVAAKAWYASRPAAPGTLSWEPLYARVSSAGDLGLSTGPWEFEPSDTTRPKAYGHFLSVWRNQAGAGWRVALDAGIGHEKPVARPAPDFAALGARARGAAPGAGVAEKARRALLAAERELAGLVAAKGMGEALALRGADDLRLYRDGAPPSVGTAAARARLAGDEALWRWVPEFVAAARSGDLGYAYGVAWAGDGAGADSAIFVRVWTRGAERRWRVAVDLQSPLPKARGE